MVNIGCKRGCFFIANFK